MESLDRLGQRLGEIRQLGLELADALAALAGQLRGVRLVVGDGVADEDRYGPVVALRVHGVIVSVAGRDDRHHFAPGIASLGHDAAADVIRDFADVLHHGRDIGEDVLVLPLEDVVGGIAFGADDEGVVDKTLAQRVDCRDSALQGKLRRDFL